MTPKLPSPPRHLQPKTRKWWKSIILEYELDGSALKLLTLAAECWDRSEQCRGIVEKEGPVFIGADGSPRKHPAINIELDAKINFARLVKQLGLPSEEPAPPTPGTRSHKRKPV